VAVRDNSARLNDRLQLLNWATTAFETATIPTSLTVDTVVQRARAIDRGGLFAEPHGEMNDAFWDRNAVVGVAAAVLRFGNDLPGDEVAWCKDVTFRAAATPEFLEPAFYSGAKHTHHPALFAVSGLEGLIFRDDDAQKAKEALLRLAGHILEDVAERATAAALSMWDKDAVFAWAALWLGVRISLGSHDRARNMAFGANPADLAARNAAAANTAIADLTAQGGAPRALPDVPPAWIHAPRRRHGDRFDDETAIWREPDEFVRWDILPKVLRHIPMNVALHDARRGQALLDFIYKLLKWTIDKLEPPWMDERDQRDHRASDLIEWRHSFGHVLAKAALEIDEPEAQRNILDPIFALRDEAAVGLINPFADILAAGGIIDPPTISLSAIKLMGACVARVLRDRAWRSALYNEGNIYGWDLPEVVRIFLFATGVRAAQAARFANGDWRDVSAVLPIVDPFVRAVGDIPLVIGSFLTLCESAVEHYPPDVFVDQIDVILEKQTGVPVGWHGTMIQSRIAALVHAFAERVQPLPRQLAQRMLRILDRLVDMGDRRSAALQTSEVFKDVRQSAA
jgi:hypothetical protein